MPLREDLTLSQEQQLYVSSFYGKERENRAKMEALSAVAMQVQTADRSGIWRRYVIARGGICGVLKGGTTKVIEGLRILPQNAKEYAALTECLGVVQ